MFVIIHLRGDLSRVNMSKCVIHHADAIMTVGKIKSAKKIKKLLKILCGENNLLMLLVSAAGTYPTIEFL